MKYLKLFEGKKKVDNSSQDYISRILSHIADLIIAEYYRPEVIDNYIDNYSDDGYFLVDDNDGKNCNYQVNCERLLILLEKKYWMIVTI